MSDKQGYVKETFTSHDWLSYWNLKNNDIFAIDQNYKDSQSFDEQNAPNAYFYFDGKINKENSNSRFSSRWTFSV